MRLWRGREHASQDLVAAARGLFIAKLLRWISVHGRKIAHSYVKRRGRYNIGQGGVFCPSRQGCGRVELCRNNTMFLV